MEMPRNQTNHTIESCSSFIRSSKKLLKENNLSPEARESLEQAVKDAKLFRRWLRKRLRFGRLLWRILMASLDVIVKILPEVIKALMSGGKTGA